MLDINNMKDLRVSISAILEYNWKDEEEDFKEQTELNDGEEPENHIYNHLLALDRWISEE